MLWERGGKLIYLHTCLKRIANIVSINLRIDLFEQSVNWQTTIDKPLYLNIKINRRYFRENIAIVLLYGYAYFVFNMIVSKYTYVLLKITTLKKKYHSGWSEPRRKLNNVMHPILSKKCNVFCLFFWETWLE